MNDLIVSNRQKHNCMGFVKDRLRGTRTLTALKKHTAYVNWFEDGDLK